MHPLRNSPGWWWCPRANTEAVHAAARRTTPSPRSRACGAGPAASPMEGKRRGVLVGRRARAQAPPPPHGPSSAAAPPFIGTASRRSRGAPGMPPCPCPPTQPSPLRSSPTFSVHSPLSGWANVLRKLAEGVGPPGSALRSPPLLLLPTLLEPCKGKRPRAEAPAQPATAAAASAGWGVCWWCRGGRSE